MFCEAFGKATVTVPARVSATWTYALPVSQAASATGWSGLKVNCRVGGVNPSPPLAVPSDQFWRLVSAVPLKLGFVMPGNDPHAAGVVPRRRTHPVRALVRRPGDARTGECHGHRRAGVARMPGWCTTRTNLAAATSRPTSVAPP